MARLIGSVREIGVKPCVAGTESTHEAHISEVVVVGGENDWLDALSEIGDPRCTGETDWMDALSAVVEESSENHRRVVGGPGSQL